MSTAARVAVLACISHLSSCQTSPPVAPSPLVLTTADNTKTAPRFLHDAERGYHLVIDKYEVSVKNALGFTPGLMIDDIREEGDTIVFSSGHFSNPFTKEKSELRVPKQETLLAVRKALFWKGHESEITVKLKYHITKRGPLIRMLPLREQGADSIGFNVRTVRPEDSRSFAVSQKP